MVNKDGSKKKMARGRLWIQLYGTIHGDYDSRWEGTWFTINMRKFLTQVLLRKRVELPVWDKFYYSILIRLQRTLVERLQMETRGPEPKFMEGVH